MTTQLFHWYARHAGLLFAATVLSAIAVERVAHVVRRRRDRSDLSTTIVSGAAFLVVKAVVAKLAILAFSLYIYDRWRLFDLDLSNPLVWIAMFVVRDFVYYWVHRAEHRIGFLWASHMVHHSPEEMSFTHAVRVPWMEALYKPWIGLWVPLAGFNPLAFVALDVLAATYGQLYHTMWGRRNRVLDWLVVTPSTHRVHHGSNHEYLDKNFAAVLIIWDRLFGTYEPEVAPVRFGLTGGKSIDTPVEALVGGYPELFDRARNAESLPAALQRLVAAPV